MEPLNCVIEPTANGVKIHDGCQMPTITHNTVAAILGLELENVEIKTYLAGGSFGRRANVDSDYHAEAAMAYDLLGREKAIKLVWTREDDLAGGYYRPRVAHQANIVVGDNGEFTVKDGVDHASIEGIADTPYQIDNFSVGLSDYSSPITSLWWRSVGHSHTGYVMEVLMDMAAEAAIRDPLDFRLAHLDENDPDQARLIAVLKLVSSKANWGSPQVIALAVSLSIKFTARLIAALPLTPMLYGRKWKAVSATV